MTSKQQQGRHRRRSLLHRIAGIGGHPRAVQQSLQPVQAVPAGMTGGAASPGGVPMIMPMQLVNVYPEPGGEYSTIAYGGLQPLFTSGSLGGGAAVAATAPGRWGQLVAAGRPHPQSQRAVRAPIAGQRGAGRTAW